VVVFITVANLSFSGADFGRGRRKMDGGVVTTEKSEPLPVINSRLCSGRRTRLLALM
jgi:hypothetical protein